MDSKKKIVVVGNKEQSVKFFIYKNFKKIIYDDGYYQNDKYKIREIYKISDIKKLSNVDKIYFVCDYTVNYSNFPIDEQDIISAKELITFLYKDLEFMHLLTIIILPRSNNTPNDNFKNYFNFMDNANIEVVLYDEEDPNLNTYTTAINIRKLYYKYIYKTMISDIQNYMVDHELYPSINLNIFERIYYRNNYKGISLYSKVLPTEKYNAVLYYDIFKKNKFFEGEFYGNIMKSGRFYSEDGELLFCGNV